MLTGAASIPQPIMRLSVMNAFPAGPLAANRPSKSRTSLKIQNACYLWPYPAFIPDFSGVWVLGLPHIVISPFQIRFTPDALVSANIWILAQLTVPKNIPESVGHLEKSIFPCRRKLSFFFTFRISIEHPITLHPLFLPP